MLQRVKCSEGCLSPSLSFLSSFSPCVCIVVNFWWLVPYGEIDAFSRASRADDILKAVPHFPDLFLIFFFSFLLLCLLQVVYSLEGDTTDTEDAADDELPFSISTVDGRGVLRCLRSLDYERKSWYQMRILAKDQAGSDGGNTATAALLVRVVDQEDQGPEFITVPSVTRVPEDAQPGTPILKVKAIDGDRGVNQRIVYSLAPNGPQQFAIDDKDGTVYLLEKLDREDPQVVNGAFILSITAQEDSPLAPSVTTEVTVLVLDVNDQLPTFRHNGAGLYRAEIDENSPDNTPVSFIGDEAKPQVFDYDQGTNGTFTLKIDCDNQQGDDQLFDISPSVVVNEAVFNIRVKKHSILDYELLQSVNCTVTATETVGQMVSTSIRVEIRIRDLNDNLPQFDSRGPMYQFRVAENSPLGTRIGYVKAIDADSGQLGSEGIRYSLLAGGSMIDVLNVDPQSGLLSVGAGAVLLDREKVNQLIVMVEARDSFGTGNR